MKSLDYNIIGSGSSGNAVRIENIMIDCGMPFKDMKEDLYKVDTLLITHDHSDHVKKQTFLKIITQFPKIKVYGNSTVAYSYKMDKVIGTKPFKVKKTTITPMYGVHDTEVTYFIINTKGLDIIYATDTCEINNPDNIKFDYLFIESNYDENKLREIGKQYAHGKYDPRMSNLRHFSTQQCKAFYYMNRRDKNSELIELHKSHRFY